MEASISPLAATIGILLSLFIAYVPLQNGSHQKVITQGSDFLVSREFWTQSTTRERDYFNPGSEVLFKHAIIIIIAKRTMAIQQPFNKTVNKLKDDLDMCICLEHN